MSVDHKTLLPPNATALERAVEAAQARLSDVPVPVDTLWDPWRCPSALLPWLAWAWSVDEWDAGWPEEIKRRVIAAAPEVHRLKGTRAAVERALKAIGVIADIAEWWQKSPQGQPGTFSLTAWVNVQLEAGGAVLTDKVQHQIGNIIERTKPLSRAYSYEVGALFGDDLALADAAAALQAASPAIEAGRNTDMAGHLAAADAAAALEAATPVIEAGRETRARGVLAAADAAAAMQIMTLQMEATA
jgi:phage tail P2-like protein